LSSCRATTAASPGRSPSSKGGFLGQQFNNLGSAGPNNNITMDTSGALQTTGAFSSGRTISVGPNRNASGDNFGGSFDSNGFDSSWGDLLTTGATGTFNKSTVTNAVSAGTVTFAESTRLTTR